LLDFKKTKMTDFWNTRYGSDEYAYGTAPNEFLKEQITKLPVGKILFPAEGEGRNAVYAAKLGWQVTAFDPSTEGKRKAENLARKNNVTIDYMIDNYEHVKFPNDSFDCVALVFAHMHPQKREEYHQKLISFLRPGGLLILEGFSKKQIRNNTGGPRDLDMLFSKEELLCDFKSMSEIETEEMDVALNEGPFHQGIASVIRVFAVK
jgi:SAM-dependent methyltransferase